MDTEMEARLTAETRPAVGAQPVKGRARLLRAVIIVCAAALVASILIVCWLAGRFLPGWIGWNDTEMAADLNGDGYLEAIQLEDRQLRIYEDGVLACTTPEGWFTSDVFVGDVDSDGIQDIVCMTWKRGSFGESKPFWIKHDDPGFSQHIFIFDYTDGELRHKWLSSDIGMEVEQAYLDPHARLHLAARDGQDYLCEWQDWGLAFVDEDNPSMREADYDTVSLIAVGDDIIHTGILEQADDPSTGTYDFSSVYGNVSGLISSYDLAAVVQEAPLVSDPSRISGDFPVFGTPCASGDALAGAGFDIVEAATNHAGDQGVVGIEDTIAFWRDNYPEVSLIGLNAVREDGDTITYRESGGVRLALFDYTFGLNDTAALGTEDAWRVDTLSDIGRLESQLETARDTADFSICFLHCGEEYADTPSSEEKDTIEQLIDAGADAVICSHPHVVQRTQTVVTDKGNVGLVCYSLGNFVANQTDRKTVLGSAVSLIIEKPVEGGGGSSDASIDGTTGAELEEDANAGGTRNRARLASCTVIPTVCHVSEGQTRVYLLQDYTSGMADEHHLNDIDEGSITLDGLQEQWVASTGHGG